MVNILFVKNNDEMLKKSFSNKSLDLNFSFLKNDNISTLNEIVECNNIDIIIYPEKDDIDYNLIEYIKKRKCCYNTSFLILTDKKVEGVEGVYSLTNELEYVNDILRTINKIKKKNRLSYKTLKIKEKKYFELFNYIDYGICLLKVSYQENNIPNFKVIKYNNFFNNLTENVKIKKGDNLNQIIPDLVEDWQLFYDKIYQSKEKILSINFVETLRKWIEINGYSTGDDHLILLTNDVSNQIETNNKVSRISKHLDQILDNSSPLCVINKQHKIILVNDSFCELFKVNRDDILGKSCHFLLNNKECSRNCYLNRILNGTKNTSFELSKKISNNKYIKCLVNVRSFDDINDKVNGIILSFTDISKLKRMEKSLIRSKEKAEESDRLKSAFLANMSHEIRTPLNAMLGFTDLIETEEIPKEEKERYIEMIKSSGNDLLKLINDIIDIAKIEAGQFKINNDEVNLNNFMKELYLTYNENPVLKNNQSSIKLKIDDQIFNKKILIDRLRLKQVLVNLINNSIKFTEEGEIEFGCEMKDENNLLFYVKDNGIGLTKKQIDIIWERFRQAHDYTTKKYGGTGLGLTISKGLINALGGDIWVESKYKEGTEFYFTIPYTPLPHIDENKKDSEKIKNSFNWGNYKILIAEDVDVNLEILEKFLKPTGVQILWAKNGKEAVEFFRRNKKTIDLVLMDIQMPIMNGLKATEKIKKIKKDIPVIAQSAYAMSNDIENCYRSGCDNFIDKPITKYKLLYMMSKYVK